MTPKELKQLPDSEIQSIIEKAKSWDKLDEKLLDLFESDTDDAFDYEEEDVVDEKETADLITIGEWCCAAFGYGGF